MHIKMTMKDLLVFVMATYWVTAIRVGAFPGQFTDPNNTPSNGLTMMDFAALMRSENGSNEIRDPHTLVGPQPPSWSIHHQRRQPRAVNLGRLRRLVNNVALSEYYRIRGLEVLDSFGVAYNSRPASSPMLALPSATSTTTSTEASTTSSASTPSVFEEQDLLASASSDTGVSLVLQSRILQKLREAYRRDKTMQNIFDYLQD